MPHNADRLIRLSGTIYAGMLRAYPREFRLRFGSEMRQLFRDRIREELIDGGPLAVVRFATHVAGDWMKTMMREHLAAQSSGGRFAAVVGLLPTIALVLHDFVFQLPDNQHEATIGFFITIGGLLSVWTACGYLTAQRAARWSSALKSAVAAAASSVGVLFVTSALLNLLFVDRMSYEPDRIRAFQESGVSTMWWFVNRDLIRNPFAAFFLSPLAPLMCAAAIVAVLGATLRMTLRGKAAE